MTNQYINGRSKPYVESFRRIDLHITDNDTLKKHYDKQGYINVKVDHPEIEGKKYKVKIDLDKIKLTFGDRYYIRCMGCSKRVEYILYTFLEKEGKQVLACGCRECFDVNYMVQQVGRNDTDYNLYMIRKLGKKLDPDFIIPDMLDYPICPARPKYMKQKTYDKINHEFNRHVNEVIKKHNKMLGMAKEFLRSV